MTSPTQRSLKLLKSEGYTAQVTEHWNGFAKVRQDLFNFIDIIGIKSNEILGIQTTSYSNISARRNKILANEAAKVWLEAGGTIQIHGWKKVKNRYQVTIKHITKADWVQ